MGLVRFSFDVANQGQIKRAIAGVEQAPKDLTRAWEAIVIDFYVTQEQRFAAEGANEGLPKWAALSKPYAAWKATSKFPGRTILDLSGSLRRSLTQRGGAGNVTRIEPMSLELGTAVRTPNGSWNLGMLHQTGTRKMPPRPPIGLSPGQKNQISRMIRMEVTDQVERQIIADATRGMEPSQISRH